MIPRWIVLAAASDEERFAEALRLIEQVGLDNVERIIAQSLASGSLQKQSAENFTFVDTPEEAALRQRWERPSPDKPKQISDSVLPTTVFTIVMLLCGLTGKTATEMALQIKDRGLGPTLTEVAAPKRANRETLEESGLVSSPVSPREELPESGMSAKIKPGVELADTPFTRQVIPVVERVYARVVGKAPTITSGTEGQHMEESFHYSGNALDWRSKDLSAATLRELTDELRKELPGMDVIVEYDPRHIHIEPSGPSIHSHWELAFNPTIFNEVVKWLSEGNRSWAGTDEKGWESLIANRQPVKDMLYAGAELSVAQAEDYGLTTIEEVAKKNKPEVYDTFIKSNNYEMIKTQVKRAARTYVRKHNAAIKVPKKDRANELARMRPEGPRAGSGH